MSILWARYVVSAGRGGIRTGLLDVEADETRGWRKGRGVPLLGLGKESSSPVDTESRTNKTVGLFANRVMLRSSGSTRSSQDERKLRGRVG